jgi:hypothetical protein
MWVFYAVGTSIVVKKVWAFGGTSRGSKPGRVKKLFIFQNLDNVCDTHTDLT